MTNKIQTSDDEIAVLYAQLGTCAAVGDKLSISNESVRRALKRKGIPRRKPPKPRKPKRVPTRIDLELASEMHKSGKTFKEVAAHFGCSPTCIIRRLENAGLYAPKRHVPVTDETEAEWLELARNGISSYRIADEYGIGQSAVSKRLRKLGYAPGKGGGATARNNARRSKEAEATRIKRLNDLLADRCEVLESNQRLQCALRCKTCGHVFKRTLDMRYEPHCPECERIRVERKRRETEELSAQRKKCRQLTKAFHLFLQAKQRDEEVNHWLDAEHVCRECGEVFTVRQLRESNPWYFSDSPTFCCNECSKRYHRRNSRHRRREHLVCGDGVSLTQLIDRDEGICYLCGKPVDKNDFNITDEGWFIAGPGYPSVDHVVPLARGGINDMSNARLAHCRCNALKSDRLLEELVDAHAPAPGGTPGLTPGA